MFKEFKEWYIREWLNNNVSFNMSPIAFSEQIERDFFAWKRKLK